MLTIDPHGMDVIEWTDRVGNDLEGFGTIPALDRPEDWKEWARAVIQDSEIAATQPPNPETYDDWREWAERFNQCIYALGAGP